MSFKFLVTVAGMSQYSLVFVKKTLQHQWKTLFFSLHSQVREKQMSIPAWNPNSESFELLYAAAQHSETQGMEAVNATTCQFPTSLD